MGYTLTPQGTQRQTDDAKPSEYQDYLRQLAEGMEIGDTERDRILAAAGKTLEDLQTDIRAALGR